MARNNPQRLYLITLRASARTVGTSRLTRGQSFTLPITEDVRKYRTAPKVWDVKEINGADSKRRAPAPVPGTPGASPVTPRASAAFTGLVNRLDVSAQRVNELDELSREGFLAMLPGGSAHMGRLLFNLFGGSPGLWMSMIRDPEGALRDMAEGQGDGGHAIKLLQISDARLAASLKDSEGLNSLVRELRQELDSVGAELHQAQAVIRILKAEGQEASLKALEGMGRAPALGPADLKAAEALVKELSLELRYAEETAAEFRGADADAADPQAEAEAKAKIPATADKAPAGPKANAAPVVPVSDFESLEAFQAALVKFQAGDDTITMAEIRDLATAAKLTLSADLMKTRRRAELGAGLVALLAAELGQTHDPEPDAASTEPTAPSPADLED